MFDILYICYLMHTTLLEKKGYIQDIGEARPPEGEENRASQSLFACVLGGRRFDARIDISKLRYSISKISKYLA
jgi:hypothetical protein